MDAKLDDEVLLDKIDEAAAILKVSERTIWNIVRRGHLRTVKILGATRIPHEDVVRLARNGT
jgi:excisionase family DNA binding protein